MNLATLRRQSRLKSGVNSKDYSDADVDVQLNQSYLELAGYLAAIGESYFEEQEDTFPLVANSSLYNLPEDFLSFKQLRLAYSDPASRSDYRVATSYDPVDTHDIGVQEENIPITNPIVEITNTYLRIKPTPTQDVALGGKIDYIAMPSALVNTGDVPVFPIQYQDLMSDYAAAQMTFKYEKWKKHDRLIARYNGKITEFQEMLADRDMNKPMRFKTPLEAGPVSRRRELPNG